MRELISQNKVVGISETIVKVELWFHMQLLTSACLPGYTHTHTHTHTHTAKFKSMPIHTQAHM